MGERLSPCVGKGNRGRELTGESERGFLGGKNLSKGTPIVAECTVKCRQDGQGQDVEEGAPAGQREDGRGVQGARKEAGKRKCVMQRDAERS